MPLHMLSAGECTVVRLPAEVILHIFQYFVGESVHEPDTGGYTERRKRPTVLSHTCSWWRALSLSSPSLWTNVVIDNDSGLWFSYLERSRPLLAQLTIIANKGIGPKNPEFSESSEDLCRIRSITLLVYSEEDEAAEMLRPFDIDSERESLPSLVSLDFRGRLGHTTHSAFRLFPKPLKTLESISLTGICPKCVPNRETLRTLEIRRTWSRVLISPQMLRDIFASSPLLETLILGPVESHHWGDSDEEPITAPSLKNLILALPSTVRWTPPIDDESPVDDLIAPNLEYLEVACPTLEGIDRLRTLILQRAGQDSERLSLTLMISGLSSQSHLECFERVKHYLPIHIRSSLNLQLYESSPLCPDAAHYQELEEGVRELQSFVLHFSTESRSDMRHLAGVPIEMRRLPSRRGFIPVVVHTATDDDGSLTRMEVNTRWPYFDTAAVKRLTHESGEAHYFGDVDEIS
ncbi:hypothetical protein FA13DRAFT_1736802 [Coprinellus micaceus]|uniref:Uncharacterized protein n=1 Tax=Coprinellus micaceus TaxID=71717 RepID=A0A4Y7SYS0_COPMI|nr:hypothetical protein FA13DRAFT_1736802 [Coprinellus micaceus]